MMSRQAETFISVLLPLEVRFPPAKVLHISESPLIDIFGMYEERDDFKIPRGLNVVTSGSFETMEAAETFSTELAMSWTAMICYAMGVKASMPRIRCVLRRLDVAGRYRLRAYTYYAMEVEANLPLDVETLQAIRERIANLTDRESERVALAVRWYTEGLGQADDLNRFLSHWIGLEAIGDLLHNKIHAADRAACGVCNHPLGRDHRGRAGGMKHALAIQGGRADLFQELDHARDRLFHALDEIQVHRSTITQNVATVETALGRAILEVLQPPGWTENLSVSAPHRTETVRPQARLEGTLINLNDDERSAILHHNIIQLASRIESGENAEDGGLRLYVSPGYGVPESLSARFVDRHFRWLVPEGVDVV
jgi:hypothetical protein